MATLVWAGFALPSATSEVQTRFGVCVEGNRIVATGPIEELRTRYPRASEFGGNDLILLPAFVNSHDHGRGLGTLPLGVPDDVLEIWLVGLRGQPAIDPYLAAAYDGLRLARSGVSVTAHSHNPRDPHRLDAESDATIRGYRDAGIRVAYQPPVFNQNALVYGDEQRLLADLPTDLEPLARMLAQRAVVPPDEYFGLCADLLRRHHDPGAHTVQIQISPVAAQWCTDDLLLQCASFACQHRLRLQMHLLETRYQREYARRVWSKSAVRHLADLGVLGPWLTLAHMVWVDEEDLPLLAEYGVGIAHNPSSNLRLRSGIAPIPRMLAAGLTVGIGLDGHSLDEDQDFFRELRLAWTLANRPGISSPRISAGAIWSMGTTGGTAITLGPEVKLGQLVPGYLADLVLLDHGTGLDDWTIGLSAQATDAGVRTLLPELILRSASHRNTRHLMVNGEWILKDGRSTRLDETVIVSELRRDLRRGAATDRGTLRQAAPVLAPYLRRFYASWDRGPAGTPAERMLGETDHAGGQ